MRGGEPTSRTKWLTGFVAVTVGASLGWSMAELAASLGSGEKAPREVRPRENVPPEHLPLPQVLREPLCPYPVHEGEPRLRLVEVAKGFAAPVHIASPPKDPRLFVLESRGRIRIVEDGTIRPRPFFEFPEPRSVASPRATPAYRFGTLAFHPRHQQNGRLFLSYVDVERELSRVVELHVGDDPERADFESTFPLLEVPLPTLDQEAASLAFGPDGYLYVSTGEVGDRDLAQDRRSLAGKILRITADGRPAPDNPFGTEVWSWGHRNVEGLAFDPDGSLWASEFGDSKADELNRILPGENYGWPRVEGTGGPRRFAQPQLTWGTDEASPSGLAYAAGYLWMAGLRGERLWRVKVAAGQASDPTAYFEGDDGGEYGRLRTVARDADGRLWLATSNKDGRGTPSAEDDRILLIEP